MSNVKVVRCSALERGLVALDGGADAVGGGGGLLGTRSGRSVGR